MPRARKRRDAAGKNEGKKFSCQNDGCGRMFTRAEHLQRHLLNHSTGEHTCDRCRAHFKRRDLLGKDTISLSYLYVEREAASGCSPSSVSLHVLPFFLSQLFQQEWMDQHIDSFTPRHLNVAFPFVAEEPELVRTLKSQHRRRVNRTGTVRPHLHIVIDRMLEAAPLCIVKLVEPRTITESSILANKMPREAYGSSSAKGRRGWC